MWLVLVDMWLVLGVYCVVGRLLGRGGSCRVPAACITDTMHIVMYIVMHIAMHTVMHIVMQIVMHNVMHTVMHSVMHERHSCCYNS